MIATAHGIEGFGVALLGAAFLLGLRHGIDWDHIAAITDMTASQESPRDGFRFGTLYVLGHAATVLVLGVGAIALGATVPASLDGLMGRVVGVTLIALGLYVVYSLIAHRNEFRMRSRWMLVIGAVRRLAARIRVARAADRTEHDHAHSAVSHHGGGDAAPVDNPKAVHSHPHTHDGVFGDYTVGTSLGVGALHGIGAETPSQVVVFLAAAHAGGVLAGVVVLLVFLAGLVLANTAITLASAFGFLAAGRNRRVYMTVGAVTGVASLVIGALFVIGAESVLPQFFVT